MHTVCAASATPHAVGAAHSTFYLANSAMPDELNQAACTAIMVVLLQQEQQCTVQRATPAAGRSGTLLLPPSYIDILCKLVLLSRSGAVFVAAHPVYSPPRLAHCLKERRRVIPTTKQEQLHTGKVAAGVSMLNSAALQPYAWLRPASVELVPVVLSFKLSCAVACSAAAAYICSCIYACMREEPYPGACLRADRASTVAPSAYLATTSSSCDGTRMETSALAGLWRADGCVTLEAAGSHNRAKSNEMKLIIWVFLPCIMDHCR